VHHGLIILHTAANESVVLCISGFVFMDEGMIAVRILEKKTVFYKRKEYLLTIYPTLPIWR
jgi:hypothetical protein